MNSFLKRIVFFSLPIISLLFFCFFLPPTPRASKSLLFANRQKDFLLIHTKEPRIIFIGGSNLSFGLNSYAIKESLGLNPINTGVHASIGIKYMLENTLQYIKPKDIVVLSFEYGHFYRDYDFVSDELFRTIYDVSPEKSKLLSLKQKFYLFQFIPRYSLTKLKPNEYFFFKEDDVYGVNSFNQFGDAYAHWNLDRRGYQPTKKKGKGVINEDIFKKIKKFKEIVENKGGTVYITFPCLDEVSFRNTELGILELETRLKEYQFTLLGNAKRYAMPKDMMFDTHYHLTKTGVEYRTGLFIEDYKKLIKNMAKKR